MSKIDSRIVLIENGDNSEILKLRIEEGVFAGIEYDVKILPPTEEDAIKFEYDIVDIQEFKQICIDLFERVITEDMHIRLSNIARHLSNKENQEDSTPEKDEA